MERATPRRLNLHPIGRIPGGTPALHPGFIDPCLATARDHSPSGDEWIHELKYDGSRTQAHLVDGKPLLFNGEGLDCSTIFASIAHALQTLSARAAILDGEVVVLDVRGAASPCELQRDIEAGRTDRLVYFVFDLLYLDGVDLRSVPLIERKRLLAHVLRALPMQRVRVASHVEADGPAVFERACEMQIAGIVSRKRESAYRSGRQDTWIEARCAEHIPPVLNDADSLITRRVVAPSREQLASYWARVAHRALKYLARRPLELVRDTPGPLPVLPESVRLWRPKGFLGDATLPVWIDDLEGLLGLANLGAIELHPWSCTIDDPDHPDLMVFELEGIEWRAVTKTALVLRDILAADGLESWPNLTGASSLQVMVSLFSPVTYDLAQRYSAEVARRVIEKDPASDGQLFIHTEANFRTRTSIGTYSPRARPGFPIVAPVTWRRIERGVPADAFSIAQPFRAM
jgi:DNA primase